MLRISLDDGKTGYIPNDAMEQAALDNASTFDELEVVSRHIAENEVQAFQSAFAEYYGIDALSDEVALDCVEKIRLPNGDARAAQAMERGTAQVLANAANEGLVDKAKARGLSALNEANLMPLTLNSDNYVLTAEDVMISDRDFAAIMELVVPELEISIPAYAEDGKTIVGEFAFIRI